MADNEYIKRSEVVCLIEEKIKRCDTVLETLAFASLRTKVMGLRSADVAPRAEVARDIFEELRKYIINHCYLADDDVDALWKHIDTLEKKYKEDNK